MKTLLTLLLIAQISLFAQTEFNIDNYREYLNSHQNMSYPDLLDEYPASKFNAYAKTNFYDAKYSDSINQFFGLTSDEISLLNSHSFMVSERLSYPSYVDGLYELFKKDIPIYLSADMMLHSVHKSVDNILIDVEKEILYSELHTALYTLITELKNYNRDKYSSDPIKHKKYSELIDDANLYLIIAQNTLSEYDKFELPESISEKYNEINAKIESATGMDKVQLFGDVSFRRYDWSQFKPRGHYSEVSKLKRYFKTLIWLGRTEIYITAPNDNETDSTYIVRKSEIMRQNRLAYFLTYLAKKTDVTNKLQYIDETIAVFIGRQDNITNFELEEVIEGKVNSADDLLDNGLIKELQAKALELNSAQQTYLSQILTSDPMIKEEIEPAAAFMLMGQRPILDGFITSKVTFDRVIYNNDKIMRMLPNSLDVLFGLGNNASIQALEKELIHYPYSSNLAALRYLINSYDDDFWSKSVYTSWLSSIRGLNPKNTREEREQLPEFMRTAAWWQKSMNTQLASWAELRHDFLLYAKQPYTASAPGCSTPDAFIEPVPEMYSSIKNIFINLKKIKDDEKRIRGITYFLDEAISIFERLETISRNCLNNSLTNEDQEYLNEYFCTKGFDTGCVEMTLLDGWYPKLFYDIKIDISDLERKDRQSEFMDFLVADIHTSPTDEVGNSVGWVKHIATGPINMAVIVTNNRDGEKTAYAGPVSSFYEFTTKDFERYTDSQWQDEFFGVEPQIDMKNLKFGQNSFTKHYLADLDGKAFNGAPELVVTSVNPDDYSYGNDKINIYPNPASNHINLSCSVNPGELTGNFKLINMDGVVVQSEVIQFVATGNNIKKILIDESIKSGAYIYSLDFDKSKYSGKVNVVK